MSAELAMRVQWFAFEATLPFLSRVHQYNNMCTISFNHKFVHAYRFTSLKVNFIGLSLLLLKHTHCHLTSPCQGHITSQPINMLYLQCFDMGSLFRMMRMAEMELRWVSMSVIDPLNSRWSWVIYVLTKFTKAIKKPHFGCFSNRGGLGPWAHTNVTWLDFIYVCPYFIYNVVGKQHTWRTILRVGLEYNEEMHRSVIKVNPIQGYLRQ